MYIHETYVNLVPGWVESKLPAPLSLPRGQRFPGTHLGTVLALPRTGGVPCGVFDIDRSGWTQTPRGGGGLGCRWGRAQPRRGPLYGVAFLDALALFLGARLLKLRFQKQAQGKTRNRQLTGTCRRANGTER